MTCKLQLLLKGRISGHLYTAAYRETRTAAVYKPTDVLASIRSRQRSAISGRPLPERTDFGPARQTHLCPSQPHCWPSPRNVLRQRLTIFSSEYCQVLLLTYLPRRDGRLS